MYLGIVNYFGSKRLKNNQRKEKATTTMELHAEINKQI